MNQSPSPQKQNKKSFFTSSRFRELVINSVLLSAAWYCFNIPAPKNKAQRMTTRLGQFTIFDGYVTPETPVLAVSWEGDFFTRTQRVVLTNFRSMHNYTPRPKDMNGWVW